jgi:hypothetical protein
MHSSCCGVANAVYPVADSCADGVHRVQLFDGPDDSRRAESVKALAIIFVSATRRVGSANARAICVSVALSRPGIPFESIVDVRMAPHGKCTGASEEVSRQEKRSPRFVLPHVHALVGTRYFERSRIPPEHHVSKRDGVGAAGQRCQRGECSLEQRAMCFDDSVNNRNTSPPEKREGQRDADECRRRSPKITEEPVHHSIMSGALKSDTTALALTRQPAAGRPIVSAH